MTPTEPERFLWQNGQRLQACHASCFREAVRFTGRERASTWTRMLRSNPVSAYAVSKVDSETGLAQLADRYFSPVYLRNATAYGHSPCLRIDLVANNLLACALAQGDIRIMSDGTPWRPLIHCRDIARAFMAFASAPREIVHNQAVNIGGNPENYLVRDVGDIVQELVPSAKIVYTGEVGRFLNCRE